MERHQWRATIGQQIADPIPKPLAELQPALPVQMWQVDERTVVQLASQIEQRRLIAWKNCFADAAGGSPMPPRESVD